MVATTPLLDPQKTAEIEYPSSDGLPMAENTKQFDWIVLLKSNLDAILPDFVAGDNLWYPVQGRPDIRMAPDVYVALGRPKGDRGSYMQWKEGGVPLTVVIEVLSPGNSTREMMRKQSFYARYGAREFIVIDPDDETGWAFVKDEAGEQCEVPNLEDWTSPTLGIRFVRREGRLLVFRPDGTPFRSFGELEAQAVEARERAERECERAERESERAERESERAARMAAKLAALGIDPEA